MPVYPDQHGSAFIYPIRLVDPDPPNMNSVTLAVLKNYNRYRIAVLNFNNKMFKFFCKF